MTVSLHHNCPNDLNGRNSRRWPHTAVSHNYFPYNTLRRHIMGRDKRERGRIQGLPNFGGYPLLSHELVKLRTSNFVGTFIGSIGTKAHENVGNSGRGRSQGVPKMFRAPICRAHCAVIFAIAQLSCFSVLLASFDVNSRFASAGSWFEIFTKLGHPTK